ncbi:RFC checkpoint protein Rad17 [Collariella sp. IMI 366227]|nr:RFC checkpoint protein Rad17 [Collariella sp. IMI 366227]
MAPPAKRRKRAIVEDSDDDESQNKNTLKRFLFSPDKNKSPSKINDQPVINNGLAKTAVNSPSPSPAPKRSTRATTLTKPASTRSPSTSPFKSRTRSGTQRKRNAEEEKEKGKSANLLTLFSKQAQRSQSSHSFTSTSGPSFNSNGTKHDKQLDDIISDPISDKNGDDDNDVPLFLSSSAATSSLSAPAAPAAAHDSCVPHAQFQQQQPPPAPNPNRQLPPPPPLRNRRPPLVRTLRPLSLDELAVHKRKVQDVRRWLDDVFAGRMRQRLLVLKGPAGSGKTTTLRLLAQDMWCEVLEWRNPANSFGVAGHGYQSAAAQFEEFLGRGFGARFQDEPITPIVMVISETLLTTTSASADSFTAHRLLGPEILRHPGTGVIEFNPVAATFLTKALELVVQKEARRSGRRRTPGPLVLQRLGEIGDIRNAISSLEFLCVKGDDDTDWGSKVAFTKPKRGAKDIPALTKSEQQSLELVSQREATLGIFHAVGKVVYNKRSDFPDPTTNPSAAAEFLPPAYLSHLARPKRSDVAVDALIDEIGTDTHTFISALHENYPLSCEQTNPADPNSSLDYLNGCLDYLSESDLLYPSWDVYFGGKGFGGGGYMGKDSGSHILRQDEMAFQVAVRGLLFSLPSPVKRLRHPTTGRAGDAHKMFYPTYLKLWRSKEELEGLVDVWATRMLKGEDDSAAARQELLLERLPYMAHIARRRRCSLNGPSSNLRIRDLERIVSFRGIGSLGAGEEEGADAEDESGGVVAVLGLERHGLRTSLRKRARRRRGGVGAILSGRLGKGDGEGEEAMLPMQSLVISDDDIEDD